MFKTPTETKSKTDSQMILFTSFSTKSSFLYSTAPRTAAQLCLSPALSRHQAASPPTGAAPHLGPTEPPRSPGRAGHEGLTMPANAASSEDGKTVTKTDFKSFLGKSKTAARYVVLHKMLLLRISEGIRSLLCETALRRDFRVSACAFTGLNFNIFIPLNEVLKIPPHV